MVLLAVLALTVLAGAIRLHGLTAPDGRLNKDEAKLALAADGVLQTGLPIMPSGRVYTRGMLNSYLIAGSFAAFGQSDLAARLPSAMAGLLLVPAVFLLARGFVGTPAALGAAAFAALAGPLVTWSERAWFPSLHLLLVTSTLYCWRRGYVEDQPRWQLYGAGCLLLALFCYEFAVLLLLALGVYLTMRVARRDLAWFQGQASAAALVLLVVCGLLFGWLALAARAGTLAGPLAEVRGYLQPGLDPWAASLYLQSALAEYAILLAPAILGWPLLLRVRPGATMLLTLALALLFLVPSFLLQSKAEIRYVLPVLPLLAVLGAGGGSALAHALASRLRLGAGSSLLLASVAVLLLSAAALRQDLEAAVNQLRRPVPGPTWVQTLRAQPIGPDDLLLTEGPERLRFYFGRADYHIYSRREFRDSADDEDRYSYQAVDGIRSIYANSLLLSEPGDFDQLVEAPNHGRTLWVVGSEETLNRLTRRIEGDLWPSLTRSARRRITTDDGWIMLRISLPLRYRHS